MHHRSLNVDFSWYLRFLVFFTENLYDEVFVEFLSKIDASNVESGCFMLVTLGFLNLRLYGDLLIIVFVVDNESRGDLATTGSLIARVTIDKLIYSIYIISALPFRGHFCPFGGISVLSEAFAAYDE